MFFLVTRWNDKVSVRRCHPSAYFFVIRVAPFLSSQCPDTGIQKSLLVSKQTSIESGYNIFDEIIWKTGSQCLYD
ncbi:hypothetical protein [Wolbachia endosymbiont (group A) of Pipizella viduata]|uniref:hypothetical protein n=1 Tax=Wolbachia endosymbiont (group A) of Pipizella viduata TaxID=3066154 RepID=UPI00333ECEF7